MQAAKVPAPTYLQLVSQSVSPASNPAKPTPTHQITRPGPWSSWEEHRIEEVYKSTQESVTQLAEEFGRSPMSVRQKIKRMKLPNIRKIRRWPPEELEQLTELCDGTVESVKQAAIILKRNYSSARTKAIELGLLDLSRKPGPPPTPGQRAELLSTEPYLDMYQNLLRHHGKTVAEEYLAVTQASLSAGKRGGAHYPSRRKTG